MPGSVLPALAAAQPSAQKQILGESLYPYVLALRPEIAGKITDMLLERANSEVFNQLRDPTLLARKVEEAVEALRTSGDEVAATFAARGKWWKQALK